MAAKRPTMVEPEADFEPQSDDQRSRYIINSALRTLDLLKIFAQKPSRFTLAELSQLTGLEKNQLYRSIKTLEVAGFVELDMDGKFQLSELIHLLSSHAATPPARSLPLVAGPMLDELVSVTGESANLFVRRGLYAVCVDRRESPQMVRLASVLGSAVPLHAGAVPKAMLAFLPQAEQEQVLSELQYLPAYTDSTVLDPQLLRRELEVIRERGFSISDEDYDASARGVGAPIFDDAGDVVAGISVGGPSFRVGKEALSVFGALAIEKAKEITLRLRQA